MVNKQLIFDCFEGKATSLQKKAIDSWVKEGANEELFYQWLQEWEKKHLQYLADEQPALQRYQQYLNSPDKNSIPLYDTDILTSEVKRARRTWWISTAATVLICFGLWKFHDGILNYTFNTGFNQKKVLHLEDGSTVALNSNSTLWVPRFSLKSGIRLVKLEGEALFSVKHTLDNKKFVVETANGEQVEVLGTEFNLFARERGTKVVLQKGKVQFHYQNSNHKDARVTMKPGDLVTVARGGIASLKPVTTPENSSEWLNNRYVFEESSILEIVHLFKDNFGINIKIASAEVACLTLSGAYSYENPEELLNVITEALNLKITRTKDNVMVLSTGPIL